MEKTETLYEFLGYKFSYSLIVRFVPGRKLVLYGDENIVVIVLPVFNMGLLSLGIGALLGLNTEG
jgi:hypothetical protein